MKHYVLLDLVKHLEDEKALCHNKESKNKENKKGQRKEGIRGARGEAGDIGPGVLGNRYNRGDGGDARRAAALEQEHRDLQPILAQARPTRHSQAPAAQAADQDPPVDIGQRGRDPARGAAEPLPAVAAEHTPAQSRRAGARLRDWARGERGAGGAAPRPPEVAHRQLGEDGGARRARLAIHRNGRHI